MYITSEEYSAILGPPPENFAELNFFASSAIDRETLYQLSGRDISLLPQPMQDAIKQATALEIQALEDAGGLSAMASNTPDSASIGSYSYSGAGGGSSGSFGTLTSPKARAVVPVILGMIRGQDW